MTDPGEIKVYSDTDEINVAQLLTPLVHHWKMLVVVPLIGGGLFALLFYLFAPRIYMSAADLVVMPPKFKTEFQESSPNVQYYRTLIESPALLASVEKELVHAGVLEKSDRLELGKQIEDSVFTKKRAEDVALSPIIRLAAYGDTPDAAYEILNTWIRHINDTIQRLSAKGKNEAIAFIDREFPRQRTQYETASKKLEDDKALFLGSFNKLDREKKKALDSFDTETGKLLNKFDAKRQQMRINLEFNRKRMYRKLETKRKELRNKLISELEPELIKSEYKNVLNEYSNFRATLKTIDVKIGSEKQVVQGLLEQEKSIPMTLRLKKKTLFISTISEIPNPDFEQVQQKILEHRLRLSSLKANKVNILTNLETLNKKYSVLRTRLNENEKQIHSFDMETKNKLTIFNDESVMKLKSFDAETAVLRQQLVNSRAQRRLKLANQFEETRDALSGKQNVTLSIAEKQKAYMENIYKMLGEKYEQARLAKAEDEVSLKLATQPFRPIRSTPRGTVKKTVIAGIVLFMFCVFWVYFRELVARIREEEEQGVS